MDVIKAVITKLKAERDRLDTAIAILEGRIPELKVSTKPPDKVSPTPTPRKRTIRKVVRPKRAHKCQQPYDFTKKTPVADHKAPPHGVKFFANRADARFCHSCRVWRQSKAGRTVLGNGTLPKARPVTKGRGVVLVRGDQLTAH